MDIVQVQEQSKFQIHSECVLSFLRIESSKNDGEKLLFQHQIDALFAVKKYFSNPQIPERPALIVAPTGAGKTGIVALMPYVLASPKSLILSPSLIITDQLEKAFGLRNDTAMESFFAQRRILKEDQLNAFLEIGKRIDVTEAISNMKKYNLIIVNAQKFGATSSASITASDIDDEEICRQVHKIKENFANFTTLIVDEAHHYPAATWDAIVNEFKGKQIIFLTATPFRGSDRKDLWENQKITYRISRQSLVEQNIIRQLIYQDINCAKEDYKTILEQILETLSQHDALEPAVTHKAMVLTNETAEAEYGARSMDGLATFYTSNKQTERHLKLFEDTEYRIIFVCGRLLEDRS